MQMILNDGFGMSKRNTGCYTPPTLCRFISGETLAFLYEEYNGQKKPHTLADSSNCSVITCAFFGSYLVSFVACYRAVCEFMEQQS